jgi:hypothetical protein
MAVISFENTTDATWKGNGWTYRQVIRDLAPYAQGDNEFLDVIKHADPLASLIVDSLEPPLRQRVVSAILSMTQTVVSDRDKSSVARFHPDKESQDLYLETLKELGAVARRYAK